MKGIGPFKEDLLPVVKVDVFEQKLGFFENVCLSL